MIQTEEADTVHLSEADQASRVTLTAGPFTLHRRTARTQANFNAHYRLHYAVSMLSGLRGRYVPAMEQD
ncbi:MAG TPA: hypothetical protein VFJ58_18025 [Armatimonadota bacterium]|nr:hypothetical protein [Armatimonadota bacterium]